ncbi:hypothetical protein BDV40DRAFT_301923 [Aspergillus tamarii]|uniref:Uncharacterized protein n=1 Tax=Aspergillus tamarii TaxID=41984 RepID=A0A5N6URY2_ASPTM|nr:hypothetical protein BDV40DRAFT_301923 [Aspergillus tamarii]
MDRAGRGRPFAGPVAEFRGRRGYGGSGEAYRGQLIEIAPESPTVARPLQTEPREIVAIKPSRFKATRHKHRVVQTIVARLSQRAIYVVCDIEPEQPHMASRNGSSDARDGEEAAPFSRRHRWLSCKQ